MNINNNKYTDIYNTHLNIRISLSNNKRILWALNLNIPLFNGFVVNYDIRMPLLELNSASMNWKVQGIFYDRDPFRHWNDANAALADILPQKAELAARSIPSCRKKLNVGLISSRDYYQSKNYLISARSELLQAKYEYIFRSKILDFYKGIPIEL